MTPTKQQRHDTTTQPPVRAGDENDHRVIVSQRPSSSRSNFAAPVASVVGDLTNVVAHRHVIVEKAASRTRPTITHTADAGLCERRASVARPREIRIGSLARLIVRLSGAVRISVASAAVALALAPAAHANIVAAVEQPAPAGRSDLDIALYDATTGTRLGLPPGVNTTDDELHPSITPDGRLLSFERRNDAGGTVRIVVVELATGKSADLFSGFETVQVPPTSPAITPDGGTVVTARPAPSTGFFQQLLTLTDVSSFPGVTTDPFAHSDFSGGQNGNGNGRTLEPAVGAGGLVAYEARADSILHEIGVGQLGTSGSCGLADPQGELDQPALPAASTDHMLFVRRASPGGPVHPGDIWFGPLHPTDPGCKAGFGGALPAIVNTGQDESRPALTPDGRYVGFVRHTSDAHSRLFVWDSLTQLLVNNDGIDLGVLTPREIDLIADRGNLSLRVLNVLRTTNLLPAGTVTFQLNSAALVGILVQRVVGHHKVLGHRVARLRLVGRVPLGHFGRGHDKTHWDGKVGGRRLRPGLYQVTVRALARNGRVEDLGQPRTIRVH
jgi:hypothetical protein